MADPDLMFDLRLGLALGKSLGEVRLLPYRELMLWRIFYLLEPWGWHDREYRTAALLAQIHNVNVTKKRQMKKIDSYVRNMPKHLLSFLRKKVKTIETQETTIRQAPDLDTAEGRALATEHTIKMFEAMFGNRVVRKDK